MSLSLREFIDLLADRELLIRIRKPVNVKYEMATIMSKLDGTPLMFENVINYSMPVVANLCSTRELLAIGLGISERELIGKLATAIDNPKEPQVIEAKDYIELEPDLYQFPILTYYTIDGGPYIASGIVIAYDRELGANASYHRMMVIGKDKLVLRILRRHFHEYIERGNKQFVICIGNPVPVLLAGAVSVELGKSELSIANALAPIELIDIDGYAVPEAEIIMLAELTGELHDEGPFLDLTQTPDIVRKQPVAKIRKIYTRREPIYHALLPGGLEHKLLMGMPREPTIFREVSKVCECKDLLITPGGCSWLHGIVSIKKRHADDGKRAIEAAFKGHRSMKHVFIVDDDINIHEPGEVEWALATRFQADKDLIIKLHERGSSLDPSADATTYETTKLGFDLTIPWDKEETSFKKPKLPMELNVEDYID
jgi:UbiD family decarboxylase